MPPPNFRVIIAGGGIAGLTLANALERANIDYVLLEARDSIHPQVGASIGIFANGGRILDQLNCFDTIEDVTVPLRLYHNRYQDGVIFSTSDSMGLIEKRFNYPITFLEREFVLRTLYNNLADKSKIKLQKRLSKVDHNQNEVLVVCEDGTALSGDILVGCDGVHSKVRAELWRLADQFEPSFITPGDKDMLFAEYSCLFGISTGIDSLIQGEMCVNYTSGFSTMVINGKDKLYWFMFKKLDKRCTYNSSETAHV